MAFSLLTSSVLQNGTFEIGGHVPNVGDIVLKKPLDFESSTKVYYLNVTATVSGRILAPYLF